jgi:Flp pilus assembly protein TadB/Mg-chelatase subunit ChlD
VVTNMRRALATAAVSVGLLAVAIHPASADPTGQVSNVQNLPGQVQFLFSAKDVPAGAHLDTNSIKVSLDGTPLQATVQKAGSQVAGVLRSRTAILVLDLSGSMAGARLAAARAAAIGYVKGLPADVQIGLITFSDTPHTVVSPSKNRAVLLAALGGVQASGNTALYDGIGAALRSAAPSATDGQTRLLILSDGDDTSSKLALGSALKALQLAQVSTDVVAFGSGADQRILSQLASAGHGRMLPANSATELASAFGAAAQSFSEQMLVTVTVPPALSGKQGRLTITLAAAGQTIKVNQELSLPTVSTQSAVAQPNAEVRPAASSLINMPMLLAATFAGLLGLCLLAFWRPAGAPAMSNRRRIAEVERYRIGSPKLARGMEDEGVNTIAKSALSFVDKVLRSRGTKSTIAADLDRAGLKLRPQEWMLLRISAGAALSAVFYLLSQSLIVGVLVGAVLGWFGTRFFLRFKMKRRCAAFADQLPDTLQLVSSSLRSGFSLLQALDGVVREGTQPAASEFSRALSDGRLGVNIEDALEKVAERMRCTDLSWVVMAIRISREVGGNLAEVLMTTVHTMRERSQVKRQVRALSAEGRLSGMILVGLPIFIGGWLFLSRRDYLKPLYTDVIGIAMLAAAVVSLCLGAWWMSKIVKIEV